MLFITLSPLRLSKPSGLFVSGCTKEGWVITLFLREPIRETNFQQFKKKSVYIKTWNWITSQGSVLGPN